MAHMVKKDGKGAVTKEKILEVILDMNERMATKEDIAQVKNDIQRAKAELLDVIEPIGKAVDKDAVTIVKHEKRITILERKVGVAVK